jgi:Nucleotidyl transferase AbiEii toxin, Type IV TA system
MNPLTEALQHAVAELAGTDHTWALVGGLAVSARLEPRFTRDLDLAISVSDDRMAESLVNRFRRRGYGILTVIEQGSPPAPAAPLPCD